jgi:hypothetical protein
MTTTPFISSGSGTYAVITLSKASKSVTYTRNFNKLDSYLSYVGGLVGTIIGVIFIMGFYTEKAY